MVQSWLAAMKEYNRDFKYSWYERSRVKLNVEVLKLLLTRSKDDCEWYSVFNHSGYGVFFQTFNTYF